VAAGAAVLVIITLVLFGRRSDGEDSGVAGVVSVAEATGTAPVVRPSMHPKPKPSATPTPKAVFVATDAGAETD
jgi:hypothetical protein